jgi:hypothetical protein
VVSAITQNTRSFLTRALLVAAMLPASRVWSDWNSVDSRHNALRATVTVATLEELIQWASSAQPGTLVVLENGRYTTPEVVTLRGIRGTEQSPVVIAARHPGKVEFHVGGFILADSTCVTIEGLTFGGPFTAKAKGALVTFQANRFCRLTGCTIAPDDLGVLPGKSGTRYMFLQIMNGSFNRFDYNRVQGKKSMGPMIAIRPTERNPLLEYSQFMDFAVGTGNGFEGLQIGNDNRYRMHAVVRCNWFENLDGEAEVISVKTTGNNIIGNTFLNNAGEVVVRAANETRIVSNLFLNSKGKKNVGGIRNHGDDTEIADNDFVGTETGVQAQCGDKAVDFPSDVNFYDPPPNTLEAAYRQSRRVHVRNNRFIGVGAPFDFQPGVVLNLRKGGDQEIGVAMSLPPTGWQLERNKIQCDGALVYGSGEVDCLWKDNEVAGVRSAENLGRTFSAEAVQLRPTPLFQQLADGKWADEVGKPLVHPGVKKEATGPEAKRFFKPDDPDMPVYTLPDVLVAADGSEITSDEDWKKIRRPEILELFRQHMYGRVPNTPYQKDFKVVHEESTAMNGVATLKQIDIIITAAGKSITIHLVLFVPNTVSKPVPTFLLICNRSPEDIDPTRKSKSEFWPAEEAIARGYGIAAFWNADVDPDKYDGFRDGIHGLLDRESRPPDAWGTIAAWAWGASRCMDYFQTDKDVAHDKVGVIGHSRGGKAALWAGAEDERFAVVCSNESGCGGAALSRRQNKDKETVAKINKSFPHWFNEDFKSYNGREQALPLDQHMLIALIAPRAVCVASAENDLWADPRGEFMSVFLAGPVYRLFGKHGLGDSLDMPAIGEPRHGDGAHYHIREGKHNLTIVDWKCYLDFADKVFGKAK